MKRGWMESQEEKLFLEEFPFGRVSRRGVLALGLSSLAACTPVVRRKGVPYVRQPEDVVEGGRSEYASAFFHAGFAQPLRVRTYQDRPMGLVELTADYPVDPYALASLYTLYDPKRKQTAAWEDLNKVKEYKDALLVLPRTTDPRLKAFLEALPIRTVFYEAWGFQEVYRGTELLFGQPLWPVYRAEGKRTVLFLDLDLQDHPAGYALARQVAGGRPNNRIYAVESGYTLFGGYADHRLALKPSALEAFLYDLAKAMGVLEGSPSGEYGGFLPALVEDLKAGGVVIPGVHLPAHLQALSQAVNLALGADVAYLPPLEVGVASPEALKEVEGAEAVLWAAEGPLPDLQKPFAAKLGLYGDYPLAHSLEAGGLGYDAFGRLWPAQALVNPIFGGKDLLSILASLFGVEPPAFPAEYQAALGEGRPLKQEKPVEVAPRVGWTATLPAPREEGRLEVVVRPEFALYDGRYRQNSYLQELPRPVSKLVWDGALYVSPEEAQRTGLLEALKARERKGDPRRPLVRLRLGGREGTLPLWVLPGLPEGVAIAPLSHFAFAPYLGVAEEVTPTGRDYPLVSTQYHGFLGEVEAVHVYPKDQVPPKKEEEKRISLYPEWPQGEHAWAMVVDLTRCIGCGLCTLACQVENNIPVVGKEEVAKGREMHWMRVDRYFHEGKTLFQPVMCQHCEQAPCEAVCPVAATEHSTEGLSLMVYNRCVGTKFCSANCPYKARRFNFYPYAESFIGQGNPRQAKESPLALLMNPEVTVRSRGVMEKCTYCVQRIESARAQAAKENRPIRTGEVRTACQEACPTQAIHFGDLLDPNDPIQALRDKAHHYTLLEEANTRPRTTYLARLENPHPKLKEEAHG
ncbi:MAG: 4Fe-4S dicluster domain-containing protein [Thermaceae bacterium]